MTTKDIKDRLLRYIPLKLEVENQRERIARMISSEQFPPMGESDGSQHTPGKGDRMERGIINRMEHEAILKSSEDELASILRDIFALEDPLEREVLKLRYCDGDTEDITKPMQWKAVAMWIYKKDDASVVRATTRLHGRAIQHMLENASKKEESHP